jgi:hypothetical protein
MNYEQKSNGHEFTSAAVILRNFGCDTTCLIGQSIKLKNAQKAILMQITSFFLEIRGMIKRPSTCSKPLASNTHMAQHKIAINIVINAAVQGSVVEKFNYLSHFVIILEKRRASNAKRGSDSIGTGGIPLQER